MQKKTIPYCLVFIKREREKMELAIVKSVKFVSLLCSLLESLCLFVVQFEFFGSKKDVLNVELVEEDSTVQHDRAEKKWVEFDPIKQIKLMSCDYCLCGIFDA